MKSLKLMLLFLLSANQVAAEIQLSENIEVYKGQANLKVTLARVLPLESNQALLKISGTDHELNDLVLLYEVKMNGSDRSLVTTLRGRPYQAFVESSPRWGGKSHTLYLSGLREGQGLSFDSKASENAKSGDLMTTHLEQKTVIAKIQAFNRNNELQAIEAEVAVMQQAMIDQCETSIQATMDLDSLTDEIIKNYSVKSYCGNAFDQVSRACADGGSNKAWIAESVKTVHCAFGEKLRLKLDGTTLYFQTTPEGVNQSDFVWQNLINLM